MAIRKKNQIIENGIKDLVPEIEKHSKVANEQNSFERKSMDGCLFATPADEMWDFFFVDKDFYPFHW